jgi:hypothetical protein
VDDTPHPNDRALCQSLSTSVFEKKSKKIFFSDKKVGKTKCCASIPNPGAVKQGMKEGWGMRISACKPRFDINSKTRKCH